MEEDIIKQVPFGIKHKVWRMMYDAWRMTHDAWLMFEILEEKKKK